MPQVNNCPWLLISLTFLSTMIFIIPSSSCPGVCLDSNISFIKVPKTSQLL